MAALKTSGCADHAFTIYLRYKNWFVIIHANKMSIFVTSNSNEYKVILSTVYSILTMTHFNQIYERLLPPTLEREYTTKPY